jgi:alanine dehydrogenase
MSHQILWLNKQQVEGLIDMPSTMKVVEEAFRQHGLGSTQMPPKLYLYYTKHNGDLRTMPAYLETEDISGVKIVNVHPDNPQKGLPTVMALFVLVSTSTGAPLAVMDATYITDVRTGAAGGIAAKYLARRDSKIVGMIGVGAQARTQLLALAEVFDIEQVKATSKTCRECERFKESMEKQTGCEVVIVDIEEACNCDILVTTTPVRKPIIKNEWIREGTHINAIGADAEGKEELDPMILKRSKIIVDDVAQAAHSGEINVPLKQGIITIENIHASLGEVIAGKKQGRTSEREITIFDSTGLAIQDVATANLAYQRAREQHIGMYLEQF